MSGHEASHEVLLAEALAGERLAGDPEVAALVAGCGHCRGRLEELGTLADAVEEAGRERREVLVSLGGGPGSADAEVERTLRGLSGTPQEPEQPRPARWRRRAAIALLAASVLAIAWAEWRVPGGALDRAADGGRFLGAENDVLEAPLGAVESYAPLRWRAREPGETYVVRVLDDTDAGRGRDVAVSPRLDEPEWNPAESEAWPARIRWQVRVWGAGGAPREQHEGSARRSRR